MRVPMRYRPLAVAAALALPPLTVVGQGTDCTVSATGVDFGAIGILDFAVDSTGEISVSCPAGVVYTVGLDGGLASAGPNGRQLSAGSASLSYGLYKNSARSELWGQQGDAAGPLSGTGSGTTQVLPVYGRIPAQTAPPPGTYTDTITITVSY